jgi:serine/threonine protein kinase
MPETKTCPKCRAELPENAPAGICPKCLMQAGLASEPDARSTPEMKPTTLTSGFVPPAPEELAKHFPQLEILELLGKGGMGAVYKARQPGLDRLVAVKILPPEIGADPAFAERFTREARALAKLSHQNVVSVFDFGQADGQFYFVMEFVDGTNLRQLIETGGLKPEEALAIVPQICEALQFAHDEGIVHRDIKPENILVDKQGRVKIADFGLAKLLGKARAEFTLTGAHQAMGTLHYMAPEQMRGAGDVDHRADIYSLGVVFYEMLTGQLPIGRFEPPSKKVHVDVRLDEIVLRSLENEPARRYQQISEVKTAVEIVSRSSGGEDVAASESRATDEALNGWAVVRQSFLILLSIAGTLALFMPWTLVTFGQTFPDGGGNFVGLAVQGWYHWFPIVGSLLAAALLVVTLSTIGRSNRPLRAILAIATGLALTSVSLFTIAAKPLTVHPESYIHMVKTMDPSGRGWSGASALAELVRLSQTTDRWTPGKRHVTIHAEPFVGSWVALAAGLLLLLLGTWEFTAVVCGSLERMAVAPLQAASEPAQALRLAGMLGPAALLIVFLMSMADLVINGDETQRPWSLLRTLLIWAFAVNLFHACFITPWILFGANRLRTLSSPGAVRAASILAMLPLSFAAFVGIPAGLWSLFALRGHASSTTERVDNPAAEVKGPALGLLLTGVLGCVLSASMATFVLWRSIVGPFTGEPGLPIIGGLAIAAVYALMIFAATRMRQLADYQLVLFFTLLAILIPPVNLVGLPIGIWVLAVLSRPGVRKAFEQNANGGHHHSATSN